MTYTYQEAVDFIAEVPKFTKKNEAANTVELLKRLGHPEEAFKVIHVAGTNGKGSVCAFLESILRESGIRTGLFISPHLVKINERFQINRKDIDDDTFTQAFCMVKDVIDSMVADGFYHPTYFEILFAVGMVIFRMAEIEYLVMETGLGGRKDATNTVAHPVLSVITSISLDHTEYLGDTVAKIAFEKAGIIKEGVPVVYDGRDPEAEKVIVEKAREMHSPAYPFYSVMAEVTERSDKNIAFTLNNQYYDGVCVKVPFLADYQVINSSIAMIAARVLDPEKAITDQMICNAVEHTGWQGRMECILPDVVIDGAHNADGIEQFLQTVKRIQKTRPVSLLFAAVVEKDYKKMIREICSEVDFRSIVVTQIEGSRKVDASEFKAIFSEYTGAPVYVEHKVTDAFAKALSIKGDGMLFCAGSLYLVGELHAMLEEAKVQKH